MEKSLVQHLKLQGEYTQITCNNTDRIKVKKKGMLFSILLQLSTNPKKQQQQQQL